MSGSTQLTDLGPVVAELSRAAAETSAAAQQLALSVDRLLQATNTNQGSSATAWLPFAGALLAAALTLASAQWLRQDEVRQHVADLKADLLVRLLRHLHADASITRSIDEDATALSQAEDDMRAAARVPLLVATRPAQVPANPPVAQPVSLNRAHERLEASLAAHEQRLVTLVEQSEALRFEARLRLDPLTVQVFDRYYTGADIAIVSDHLTKWGQEEVEATRASRRALKKFNTRQSQIQKPF